MAKPIVQFSAVAYDVNGYQGLRPQLIKKDGVVDLDLCREIVNERRLTTSPEELFHGFSSLVGVAMKKVAEDGRPRAITKLIKFAPFATGKLESPSSPWNETCKANVRAILLSDAKMTLDATFQNVTEGIGVRLNDVTWLGAMTVQNVLKVGADFSANGSHMEFIEGDTAVLKVGEIEYALENTSSDVSHAVFTFPEALEGVEPGTQAMFIMKSRGGVADGQVYTVKKLVTILAGDAPKGPKITKIVNKDGVANSWHPFGDELDVTAANAAGEDAKATVELLEKATGKVKAILPYTDGNTMTRVDAKTFRLYFRANPTDCPDSMWADTTRYATVVRVKTDNGEAVSEPLAIV